MPIVRPFNQVSVIHLFMLDCVITRTAGGTCEFREVKWGTCIPWAWDPQQPSASIAELADSAEFASSHKYAAKSAPKQQKFDLILASEGANVDSLKFLLHHAIISGVQNEFVSAIPAHLTTALSSGNSCDSGCT